jgi:hypothetical protein
MQRKKTRRVSRSGSVEGLENRQLLSGTIATQTAFTIPATALVGQTISFVATVTSGAGPVNTGSVNLLDNGTATGLSANVNASGIASFTFDPSNALYAGTYSLSAQYVGAGNFTGSSSGTSNIAISLPTFTTLGDGLQEATVTQGTGAGAVTGQTITAKYTGFYQSSGAEFDESAAHAPGTFNYILNDTPEQVITGFDEGTTGIKLGETRVLVIPSALGYQDGQVRVFVIQDVGSGTQSIGAATQLGVNQAPSTVLVGQAISTPLVVNVLDGASNLLNTDTSNVTVSIATGPAGAALGGTTTIGASGGQATFSDLTFSQPGTYTLTATDGSLTSVTSSPITVTATPPSQVVPTFGNVKLVTSAVAGAKLNATLPVVITNTGSTFKGNATINLFADTGTTLDGNQLEISSSIRPLVLRANQHQTLLFSAKSLPGSLPAGTYYLLAEVTDPSGGVSLTATTQTVTVSTPFVQPVATVLSVLPHTIAPNRFGAVAVSITNDGNVASSTLIATLSPSADGATPVSGVTLDTLQVRAVIQPGKKRTFILRFKVPSTLTAGTYFPYVLISLDGATTTAIGSSGFTVS